MTSKSGIARGGETLSFVDTWMHYITSPSPHLWSYSRWWEQNGSQRTPSSYATKGEEQRLAHRYLKMGQRFGMLPRQASGPEVSRSWGFQFLSWSWEILNWPLVKNCCLEFAHPHRKNNRQGKGFMSLTAPGEAFLNKFIHKYGVWGFPNLWDNLDQKLGEMQKKSNPYQFSGYAGQN